jgi:hypothetical protein
MGYDEYPLETMAVKKSLLQEAVEKDWVHIFEHDLEMPVCKLSPTERPDVYEPLDMMGTLREGLS